MNLSLLQDFWTTGLARSALGPTQRDFQPSIEENGLNYELDELLLELALHGGCGFVEHPQWPLWAVRHDPCSIWASTPAKLLKSLRCCSVVGFDQCVVGAEAKKPTTLLLLRLDSLRHDLLCTGHSGRCPHGHGAHERLQGRTDDGTFRTAVGKIYPAGLNRAIGKAVCRYAVSTLDCQLLHQELPIDFRAFEQVYEELDVVQPDFHGADYLVVGFWLRHLQVSYK